MAEALAVISIIANIVQLVEFDATVLKRLEDYHADVKDIPKAFRDAKVLLPLIADCLGHTNEQVDRGEVTESRSKVVLPIVTNCQTQVELLVGILDKTLPAEGTSKWKRGHMALLSFVQEKKIQQILTVIRDNVQILTYHHVTNISIPTSSSIFLATSPETAQTSTPPKPLYTIPYPSLEAFIGREEQLEQLYRLLCLPGKHCRAALVGLGGIRKTRIALEFANHYKAAKSISVFWVHAGSLSRIQNAYRDIAREAKISGWDSEDPTVDKLQLVKDWLDVEASGKWVMIVDNADNLDLLYGIMHTHDEQANGQDARGVLHTPHTRRRLADYFPRSINGSILLTTRNRQVALKCAPTRNVISITSLTVSESERLLVSRVEDDVSDSQRTPELVELLQCVPLALVQASAFMSANGTSIDEYLKLYRGSDTAKMQLLSEDFEDDVRDSEIRNPTATTFAISFEHIKSHDTEAAKLLSLMSMLDTQAIPKSLLESGSSLSFEKALGRLKAFSLVSSRHNQSYQSFDLHRLVRLAVRRWLSMNNELSISAQRALEHVAAVYPDGIHENRETWTSFLPHALAILSSDHLPAPTPLSPCPLDRGLPPNCFCAAHAKLLFRFSKSLFSRGEYTSAEPLAQKADIILEKSMGSTSLHTLEAVSLLAKIAYQSHRDEEAEKLFIRSYEGKKAALGKDHEIVLREMGNLAAVYEVKDRFDEAEKLCYEAVSICGGLDGDIPPQALMCIEILARNFARTGRVEEGIEIEQRMLELRRKILGERHPETLSSLAGVARRLQAEGRWDEAELLQTQVLADRKEVIGEKHPHTLQLARSLAGTYRNQGRLAEAAELAEEVLNIQKSALGPKQPDTLATMAELASTYSMEGRHDDAIELGSHLLTTYRENSEDNEHNTLEAAEHLASFYYFAGRFPEAAEIQKDVMRLRQEVSGEGHTDTLRIASSLWSTYIEQHETKKAESLVAQALEICQKHLGVKDPITLKKMDQLATTYEADERFEDAEHLWEQVFRLSRETLGDDHRDTSRRLEWLQGCRNTISSSKYGSELESLICQPEKEVTDLDTRHTLETYGPESNAMMSSERDIIVEEID